jgi:hypothetical protein
MSQAARITSSDRHNLSMLLRNLCDDAMKAVQMPADAPATALGMVERDILPPDVWSAYNNLKTNLRTTVSETRYCVIRVPVPETTIGFGLDTYLPPLLTKLQLGYKDGFGPNLTDVMCETPWVVEYAMQVREMDYRVSDARRYFISLIGDNDNGPKTVGQLERMCPTIVNYMPERYKKALAAQRQRSPLPRGFCLESTAPARERALEILAIGTMFQSMPRNYLSRW